MTKKRRGNKTLTEVGLQQIQTPSGVSLDKYLYEKGEVFILALHQLLMRCNKFSTHEIYRINSPEDKLLHTVLYLNTRYVDVTGRYEELAQGVEFATGEIIPKEKLKIQAITPTELEKELQLYYGEDELYYELRELRVFIEREWFNVTNFYSK